jgi:hypothetical protein
MLDLGNLAPQSQSLDTHNQTNVYIYGSHVYVIRVSFPTFVLHVLTSYHDDSIRQTYHLFSSPHLPLPTDMTLMENARQIRYCHSFNNLSGPMLA